jgi:hypothetical protein
MIPESASVVTSKERLHGGSSGHRQPLRLPLETVICTFNFICRVR